MSHGESGNCLVAAWISHPASAPPPTVPLCCSCDLWGELWPAPHWWRVSTAAAVQAVAPHSSLHHPFCSQAENNRASRLSSKWKLSASHFLKVLLGELGSRMFISPLIKETFRAWAVCAYVCRWAVYLPFRSKTKALNDFVGGLLIAKSRIVWTALDNFSGIYFDVMENYEEGKPPPRVVITLKATLRRS